MNARPGGEGTTDRPERPLFTGVTTFRDSQGRYSVRHPSDWNRFDLDGREGVLASPQEDVPLTYVAVWVEDTGESVVAEDLPHLRDGVDAGLARLPGYAVESGSERTYGNVVRIERIYTFDETDVDGGAHRRKRRAWMLYADQLQFVVTYQGEDPTEYAYWLPMGSYAFATFELPEVLWFATDPEITHPADA